jgi:uridine phosphorylase
VRKIPSDQLPINDDGSVFHLHLKPEHLADRVVMMGDPGRVPLVASKFDSIEFTTQNREFRTVTGYYKGKRITALSHGIGCGNIDIVMNELDALANVDFSTRQVKPGFRQLNIVRIGTCGGLQPFCPTGSYVVSEISMGMDGLLFFYEGFEDIINTALANSFTAHTDWASNLATPYFVRSDRRLAGQIGYDMKRGITISASGFYGPQGRHVRLGLNNPDLNEKIMSFEYGSMKIANYEMESAALAGLSRLMGHCAMTVCLVVAGRYAGDMNTNYMGSFDDLIIKVLDRI